MKLSNFKLVKTTKRDHVETYFGTVDCTTGILWMKKTETREVFRELAGFWSFADTGKFTPGTQVEELARAYKARTGECC